MSIGDSFAGIIKVYPSDGRHSTDDCVFRGIAMMIAMVVVGGGRPAISGRRAIVVAWDCLKRL